MRLPRAAATRLALLGTLLLLLSALAPPPVAPTAIDVRPAAAPLSTLRIGSVGEPDSLNPFVAVANPSFAIFSNVYDLLVGIGDDLTPVPQLARNWSVSPDGLAWTFNLFPGVVWHDDTPTIPRPFTSADVKFTIEYIQTCRISRFLDSVGDPTDPAATYIRQIDTPSATQVVLHTNRPKATIFDLPMILPSHHWSQVGCQQAKGGYKNDPPIGTGMYKFVVWQKGQFLRLALHDRYHFLNLTNDYVDEIVYQYYNTDVALLNDFLLGNVDATDALTAQQFLSLPLDIDGGTGNPDADPDPDITKFVSDSLELAELGYCSATDALIAQYGVTGDRHWLALNLTVRQAVANAMNKTRLVDTIWSGTDAATGQPLSLAKVGSTLIPPATPFWHYNVTAQEELTYAVARSAARLSDPAGDGYTTTDGNPPNLLGSNLAPAAANNRDAFGDVNGDGVREVLDMAYVAAQNPQAAPQTNRAVRGSTADRLHFGLWLLSTDAEGSAAADIFLAELAGIGVRVEKKPVSFAQLLSASYSCDYDLFIWGWFFGVDPDFALSVMTTDQILGWQDAWYSDAAYDASYLDQQTKVDLYQRQAVVHAMQRQLYRDQPYNIMWYTSYFAVARTDRFTGWGDWAAHPGRGLTGYGNVFTMLDVRPVFGSVNLCPGPVFIDAPFQPRVVFVNASAAFNGTAIDPEGDPLNWTWTWSDGTTTQVDTPAGVDTLNVTHAWATPGDYNITLTVTDNLCGAPTVSAPLWVRVVPPPQGWIAGLVTDGTTGAPIAGATISVDPAGTTVTTAADGSYNVTVAPGAYTVNVSAALYLSQGQGASVVQDTTTVVNFALSPTPGWIAGTVTDAVTGMPLSGVALKAVDALGIETPGATAADGTYNFTLAPGTYTVIVALAPGYVNQSRAGVTVLSGATAVVDFSLQPERAWLIGRVTDATTGSPLAGVTLKAVDSSGTEFPATTLADGTYNLTLAPGTYTVIVVLAPGYVNQSRAGLVLADGFETSADFQLVPDRGWIVGRVTDASTGSPLAGVTLKAVDAASREYPATTLADGTYNLTLAPGTYTVIVVLAPGYVNQSRAGVAVQLGQATSADFALSPPRGWIAGTVTDAQTGKALGGVSILVVESPSGFSYSAITAADGTYNVTVTPGTYSITATLAPAYSERVRSGVAVSEGQAMQVDLRLEPVPAAGIGSEALLAGGVGAAIAIAGILAFLLLRRRRKSSPAEVVPPTALSETPTVFPPPPMALPEPPTASPPDPLDPPHPPPPPPPPPPP